MNQRVRPEVAGPMTFSVKSGIGVRAFWSAPDFADAHPGYAAPAPDRKDDRYIETVCSPDERSEIRDRRSSFLVGPGYR